MDIVSKNTKVSIAYAIKNTSGNVIEEVFESFPLVYLHGFQNIISGLEEALEGKSIGDQFSVTVKSEKGYGPYRKNLMIEIPKEDLKSLGEIWIGMEIEADQEDIDFPEIHIPEDPREIYGDNSLDEGNHFYTIREIRPDTVLLDGNHPFAGMDLTFEVSVLDIQPISLIEQEMGLPEEILGEGDTEDDDFDEDSKNGRFW
ncbi:MAG: FKBP-type peptidyl-prolyl cis-trans isomerase [Fibrobacter sp.]|jgi:FKBP-type peptidyl-prolyl cis-trans isomerase SlyD|nr:FKBP-type peptidyl-prolyl cis-trans isomerase [Fibrobacter sp.]